MTPRDNEQIEQANVTAVASIIPIQLEAEQMITRVRERTVRHLDERKPVAPAGSLVMLTGGCILHIDGFFYGGRD
jgi:hypothetical protein